MKFEHLLLMYCFFLFTGMIILLETGRRYGKKKLAEDQASEKGMGAIDGAVFGLLGLMIALTFTGAASRLEARRYLITEEANAIGTAWLRIDLLQPEAQKKLRDMFRSYLDMRLETYKHAADPLLVKEYYAKSENLQVDIWKYAVANCESEKAMGDACKLLLPSLNAMIDITTTRLMATKIHPPLVIYMLMGFLSLIAALLAGYGMAGNKMRNLMHMIVFSVVMSLAIYIILDLEYPRIGFITVDNADVVLINLRNSMN